MSHLLLITTGGTIGGSPYDDPVHPPAYTSFEAGADPVRDFIVSLMHFPRSLKYEALPPRDSKDIDQDYRDLIEQRVAIQDSQRILISHGTDAILTTAAQLFGKFPDKFIILTGGMAPLANGSEVSDGFQNLTFAVDALTANPAETSCGVYIVLSDYEAGATRRWLPRLYNFTPGKWRKHHDSEALRSRIISNQNDQLYE